MIYYARLSLEDDGGYSVDFPELKGCLTCGDDLDDALYMAKDALDGYLASLDSHDLPIARPKIHDGKEFYPIEVDPCVAFSITLKQERKKRRLTQQALADKVGMTWSQYQKLENPDRANPTLKTISKLNKALGGGIVFGL